MREIEWLLREAFHTGIPAADFTRLSSAGEWAGDPGSGRGWVNDLLTLAHELRECTPPRPYWAARRAAPAEQPVRIMAPAPQRFAELVDSLKADGYLDRDCGYGHFGDFDTDAGGRVYRALINRLLAENAVELRLADTGEDTGRLVHVVDEARADLIERALDTPDPEVAGRVEHAIALFRGRDATEHDKRSAAITLAGSSRSAAR